MEGIEISTGDSVPVYNIDTSNTYGNITDLDISSDSQDQYETAIGKRKELKRRRTNINSNTNIKSVQEIKIPIIKAYNVDVKAM